MVAGVPAQIPMHVLEATIANTQSLSDAVICGGLRLFGIIMPSNWTAANLTFQVSFDGGTTYQNLYDDNGVEVLVVAAASRTIVLRDPTIFASVTHFKIRSGTSATPVAQKGSRTIEPILRSI